MLFRSLGGGVPKQLLDVAGRPVLERSVSAFLAHPEIDEVVVALPSDLAAAPPAYLAAATKPLRVVVGGARRQDSVAQAFRALNPRAELVVIHDAARPFASADLISRTIAAAAASGAACGPIAAQSMERASIPRTARLCSQSSAAGRRAAGSASVRESAPCHEHGALKAGVGQGAAALLS